MAVDQTAIARSMLDYVNAWTNKPASFTLDGLAKAAPSATILQLATSGVLRRYVNGSFVGVWSFAVYFRLNKADTAGKLDVLDLFDNLKAYFKSTLPTLSEGATASKIEQLSTPYLSAADDDGTEDYQATYRLEYKA